ncbi:methyltransferase type 12 [Microbulbifer sp. A4B17]|uniref:methyltransferase n=1 Tax=Microbulbifer sp. A4B17 TaxID=359370 RepID=UPI000D52E2DF|nr:methyltransferase [Microbulbifer sp. A4B17]AWF83266.1 methyltransferase type 12 [Microbulbifer sp. A4B17]
MSTLETNQLDSFEQGKQAALAGEIDLARELLRPISNLNPFHPATYFLCYAESKNGSILNCDKYVLTFISRYPHHVGMRIISTMLNIAKGDIDQAEKDIKIALKYNPEHKRALKLFDQVKIMRIEKNAREAIEILDTSRSHPAFSRLSRSKAAKQLKKIKPLEDWDNNELQAKIAFFHNCSNIRHALKNFNSDLITSAVELGYCSWPKKLHKYVQGCNVLDVGCGFGGYAMGYLCAGANSYTGVDPAMVLDSRRVRNKRIRKWVNAPMSGQDIIDLIPDIDLHQCSTRDLVGVKTFDTVCLHNVTEHLLEIEDVFEDIAGLLTKGGKIIFLHHNFYGWSGHHMPPHNLSVLDENNPDHLKFCDWNHINIFQQLPHDHYLHTHLNRIRIDELRSLTRKYFNIDTWELQPSHDNIMQRLTPEIKTRAREEIPDITLDEMKTNVVFCVAYAK